VGGFRDENYSGNRKNTNVETASKKITMQGPTVGKKFNKERKKRMTTNKVAETMKKQNN
jgi:hypothetical protein